MKKLLVYFLAIILITPILGGCASKYGEQKTVVNYYPACYQPISDLREREHNVAKTTAGGAVVGALGGALIGLLASGGKWQGAVMGAAAGGVTGTVAGNIYASKQQEADDNRRLASYLQDIDGDISNLDVVGAAARNSLQCYDRQFAVLVRDMKAGTITREAAQARYGEISTGREEAIAILGQVATQARSLDQQYEEALMAEQRNLQTPVKMAEGPAVVKRKAAAINTARKRKAPLVQAANSFDAEKSAAQRVSSSQNQEMQAVLRDLDVSKSRLEQNRV